jgi:hypothetical protein
MKRKILFSVSLLLQALALTAGTPNLVQADASAIRVGIESTPYVTVSKARAVQENDKLKISGVLTRPSVVHLTGHIDLVVFGPDGSLVEKKRIRVTGLRSKLKRRIDIPFAAVLEPGLAAGSQVILRYHAPGDPQGKC